MMGKKMSKSNMPIFFDVEASSLSGDSYPIQIAWNDCHGDIHCYLINPFLYPDDYTDWSPESELIHGFSRAYLRKHGHKPDYVADDMLKHLGGHTLFSDAPDFDGFWIRRLFQAVNKEIDFKFGYAIAMFEYIQPGHYKFSEKARKDAGPAHKADNDVRYLLNIYRALFY